MAYRKKTRVTMLCAVGLLAVLTYGHVILIEHLGHHVTTADTQELYYLGNVIVIVFFLLYILWEVMTKQMSSWHYALTDVRAIVVGANGKFTGELFWSNVTQIALSTNSSQWTDLSFASRGGSKPLRFLCVPDAQFVYQIAEEMHSA